tara:strand:+ start:382 stop:534 length:153 start_codon:yes stop_codon:yes gene_type:complete
LLNVKKRNALINQKIKEQRVSKGLKKIFILSLTEMLIEIVVVDFVREDKI